jgi:hypothetical protein
LIFNRPFTRSMTNVLSSSRAGLHHPGNLCYVRLSALGGKRMKAAVVEHQVERSRNAQLAALRDISFGEGRPGDTVRLLRRKAV